MASRNETPLPSNSIILTFFIDSLLSKGDKQRALAVAEKWEKELPACNIPYTSPALSLVRCYYENDMAQRGDAILSNLLARSDEWLSWTSTIGARRQAGSLYTSLEWLKTMQQALATAFQYERKPLAEKYYSKYEHHANQYQKN